MPPLFSLGVGACSITTISTYLKRVFENISVLNSYFIHRYIIIMLSLIYGKIRHDYYVSYGPFSTSVFQKACFPVRMAPGQGYLCHIDIFLVFFFFCFFF